MGREIRRVPLDFDWPTGKVWGGFLSPDRLREKKCGVCDGTGYSGYARWQQARWYGNTTFDPAETGCEPYTIFTAEVRAFAQRNVDRSPEFYGTDPDAVDREAQRLCDLWNNMWCHHLHQDDVDALIADDRLWDFTRTWIPGEGWKPLEPRPEVTAEQVNRWSLQGLGHDSLNCWIVVRAACERNGKPYTCDSCEGHGSHEVYPGQRAEAEAWQPTGPPAGDGWQMWETVSEGSPVSPVFASANDLAAWMSDLDRGDRWVPFSVAQKFIADGWAPTGVSTPETGFVSGVEWVGLSGDDSA